MRLRSLRTLTIALAITLAPVAGVVISQAAEPATPRPLAVSPQARPINCPPTLPELPPLPAGCWARFAGDWDGNGTGTPGIVRAGQWKLSNTLGGPATTVFNYGLPGDTFVPGDWDRNRAVRLNDTPGIVRDTTQKLSNTFGGPATIVFDYAPS